MRLAVRKRASELVVQKSDRSSTLSLRASAKLPPTDQWSVRERARAIAQVGELARVAVRITVACAYLPQRFCGRLSSLQLHYTWLSSARELRSGEAKVNSR